MSTHAKRVAGRYVLGNVRNCVGWEGVENVGGMGAGG
jgi:hypothetical protein